MKATLLSQISDSNASFLFFSGLSSSFVANHESSSFPAIRILFGNDSSMVCRCTAAIIALDSITTSWRSPGCVSMSSLSRYSLYSGFRFKKQIVTFLSSVVISL